MTEEKTEKEQPQKLEKAKGEHGIMKLREKNVSRGRELSLSNAISGSSNRKGSIMVKHVGMEFRLPGSVWQVRRSNHQLGAASLDT